MTPGEFNEAVAAALARAERETLPAMQRAYRRTLRAAARRAADAFSLLAVPLTADAQGIFPEPDELIDAQRITDETLAATRRSREQAVEVMVGDVLAAAGLSFEVGGVFSRRLLDHVGIRAGNIDASFRNALRGVFDDAMREGWTVPQTAARVRATLKGVSDTTATMLARTDLISLANGSSIGAARMVLGEGTQKQWLSSQDERVRPTHQDADGQVVPMSQPFGVGMALLDYPGDPSGPDEEVINCRCTVLYLDAGGGDVTAAAAERGTLADADASEEASMETTTETFGAIRSHDTDVTEGTWDGGAAVRRCPNTESALRALHAWVDPDGDPDAKASYKLPHHEVSADGDVGAANLNGVRNALSRLPQADIPESDHDAVQAHLQNHLDAAPDSEAAADVEVFQVEAAADAQWQAVLAVEGVVTEDGRMIERGALSWRDLPLTLMALVETSAMGGHDGALIAGRIDRVWREGDNVMGEGVWDSGEFGQEVARLVGEGTLNGVSVDLAVLDHEMRDPDTGDVLDDAALMDLFLSGGKAVFTVLEGVIGMATVAPFQAIEGATITSLISSGILTVRTFGSFVTGEVVTASAAGLAPVTPPSAWFNDPALDGPTPLTVTDEGRVYGHVALWGTCHTASPRGQGVCTTPPRSMSGYSMFHLGSVVTAEGEEVAVGTITLDTGHAPMNAGARQAAAHYDHTGTAVADVRCGEDEHGIWATGALRPDLPASRVRELKAAKPSGDWRRIDGSLELIGLLAVNVPGFPVPRAEARMVASGDSEETTALIAAGPVTPSTAGMSDQDARIRLRVLAARAKGGLAGLADLAR